MAEIKDLFQERKKRQQDKNKNLDYKEVIRAHRLSVFIKTVIICAVVIGLIVVLNITWKEKIFTDVTITESTPLSIVTGANTRNLDGNILIYSKDGASCLDAKGKAVWNESFEMQSPVVSVCNSTVAIGDYNGREIYVANKEKTLGTIKTNLPIRSIAVSDTGEVVAALDDSDVIRINVYDGTTDTSESIVHGKATMNKSGYPISISLSPNGKLMMVSYFYVDSGSMKSSLAFYNFGDVGDNKVDNLVSGFDYVDTVIPYVQFMDNDSAFGVSDDRIVFFQGGEIPNNVATGLLEEHVLGIYHGSDYMGLVYLDTSGETMYRMDVYGSTGNKLSSIHFDTEYTDIVFNKDQVIIYGGFELNIYSVKGTVKYSGILDDSLNLLIPGKSAYKYTILTGNDLEQIELN